MLWGRVFKVAHNTTQIISILIMAGNILKYEKKTCMLVCYDVILSCVGYVIIRTIMLHWNDSTLKINLTGMFSMFSIKAQTSFTSCLAYAVITTY